MLLLELVMAMTSNLNPSLPILSMDWNYQYTPQMATANSTTTFSSGSDQYVDDPDFEVSDFLSFENWAVGESEFVSGFDQNLNFGYHGNQLHDLGGTSSNQSVEGYNISGTCGNTRVKNDIKGRIAFRMKSEVEVLDDGFKWRKYGKKMVKNNPNPRNYYKCSFNGCEVKKRIERDKEDPRYVITTYEGHHTHDSPK